MTAPAADRDFHKEILIHADRDRVWEVLADPRTMPQASPELFAVTRRSKGPYRVGESFLGWNRRGAVIWPTVSTVTAVDPGRELSWHTKTSGAIWTYTLADGNDGSTVLSEHRHMPNGAPSSVRLFANALLGGMSGHADELEEHVSRTLQWIKQRAEA